MFDVKYDMLKLSEKCCYEKFIVLYVKVEVFIYDMI